MNSKSFIRVWVQKKIIFEFKFEFGKTIEFFRVQVRVCVQVRVGVQQTNINDQVGGMGPLKSNFCHPI